ncbi:hypothetical protein F4604DRAFT_534429 [Suillus subluteus]|nr:hypothetical protein F4604DRAFT_534429 [Suillus subluteus]
MVKVTMSSTIWCVHCRQVIFSVRYFLQDWGLAMNGEADDVFHDADRGLAMFLYETFIANREPITELPEATLLQASEIYWAFHPPNQISSGYPPVLEPLQLPDDPLDEEYFTVHPPNEAGSDTEDRPEPSRDGPTEVGVPEITWQCGWMDETTNRRCPELVPAGRQPMLSHLNTAHGVRGAGKTLIKCKWVVLRSGYEIPCGQTFQRRNIPRHTENHLRLRHMCKLCGAHFCRADLLKSHERKNHRVQDTSA